MTNYLNWQSDLSLQAVFAGSPPVSYPEIWGDGILYLSSLKDEKGRTVIMFLLDGMPTCLTPKPYNLGTKFSEYGGKPFWIENDKLIFANQSDQCLYCQMLSDDSAIEPVRVSPKQTRDSLLMYAEVRFIDENRLMCIIEQESVSSVDDRENRSFVAIIDSTKPELEPVVLIEGADFYSNLCIDLERKRIAWVQWNHPNMPWDETELWIADFESQSDRIEIFKQQRIQLEDSVSVCQLLFASNGKLFFSADFSNQKADSPLNYWNLYAIDPGVAKINVVAVTKEKLEFAYPHWQYGDARIVQFDRDTILSIASSEKSDLVFEVNQNTLETKIRGGDSYSYSNLSSDGKGKATAVMLSAKKKPSISVFKEGKHAFEYLNSPNAELDDNEISLAEHIEFPTSDGNSAFGFYYPPTNAAYSEYIDAEELPPLIVMVHGGPTAKAYGFFDIQKQFWTQHGFAILDVNHRGSNGYGRQYRDALYGEWGELDACDIVDGIKYLVELGKIDKKRVCIRGKSAGGYAVLRALTEYPEVFRAGACYYGIGNLVTLAETTHKFEKYYADRMIGESFDKVTAKQAESRFQTRSPINKTSQLRCAMIVFQGLKDKVVPPKVAHELIAVLKDLGLDYSYIEYPDEGHGFKQAINNIDALGKELNFFRTSLTT